MTMREFKTFAKTLRYGFRYGFLQSVDFSFQIYIAGRPDAEDTIEILRVIRERLIPGRVLLLADPEQQDNVLLRKNAVVSKLKPQKGRATVLVCRRHACSVPITNPSELASQLDDTEFSNL